MKNIKTAVATTTGKRILNTLGVVAVICAAAVPGYSATATGTIDFSGNSGGTISASTTVGGIINAGSFSVPFNELIISGAGTAADDGTWLLTGTALTVATGSGGSYNFTLDGTVGTCLTGCGAGSNLSGLSGILETFSVSSMLESATISNTTSAYNVNGTSFTMEFGAPTSLSDSASLLSRLGETGGTTSSFTPSALGNINGSGTNSAGTFTGSSTSANDDTKVTYNTGVSSTPEPVSFILLGTGLLGVGFISRRRSAAVRS